MNPWKTVWNAYYQDSSKSAYALELWRLSTSLTRIIFLISAACFIAAIIYYAQNSKSLVALPALMVAEGLLLITVDHMKGKSFAEAFGETDSTLAPAENEDQRGSRYLIFRSRLSQAGITKSHLNDLFPVLEAKIDLESHRNERLNKFLVFASGFLTALAISWIRGFSASQAAFGLATTVVIALIVAPALWLLPSRRERLKELKYFMRLYANSVV